MSLGLDISLFSTVASRFLGVLVVFTSSMVFVQSSTVVSSVSEKNLFETSSSVVLGSAVFVVVSISDSEVIEKASAIVTVLIVCDPETDRFGVRGVSVMLVNLEVPNTLLDVSVSIGSVELVAVSVFETFRALPSVVLESAVVVSVSGSEVITKLAVSLSSVLVTVDSVLLSASSVVTSCSVVSVLEVSIVVTSVSAVAVRSVPADSSKEKQVSDLNCSHFQRILPSLVDGGEDVSHRFSQKWYDNTGSWSGGQLAVWFPLES